MKAEFNDGLYRQGRCGSSFDSQKNKLYLFKRDEILVVRGYPDLRAWRKTPQQPLWHPCRPAKLNLNFCKAFDPPFPSKFPNYLNQKERRRQAMKQFVSRFPPEIVQLVTRFACGERHYHLLQLAIRCPGGIDLLDNNPGLAFALANNWVFHKPPVDWPLRSARRLLQHHRQREIAGWLGFAATEAARRTLRKVHPGSVSLGAVLFLRTAMRDAGIMKLLGHLPVINQEVIRLVTTQNIENNITPQLLADIAGDPRESKNGSGYRWAHRIEHILGMANALFPRRRFQFRFKSRNEIDLLHGELISRFDETRTSVSDELGPTRFPEPPFTDVKRDDFTIIALRDSWMLREEAQKMHHCVFGFGRCA